MAQENEIQGLAVKASMKDSNLKQEIKNISSQLKEVKSEFNVAQSGAKNFGSSLDGLNAKSANMVKQINLQSQMVDKLKESLNRSVTSLEKNKAKQAELATALQSAKSAWEQEVALSGKSSEKAKELEAVYKKLETRFDKQAEKIQKNNKSITDANMRLNNAKATLNTMQNELSETNAKIELQSSKWYQLSQACETTAARLKAVGTTMKSIGSAMTTTVTMPTLLVGGAGLGAAANFEEQMDKVLAISGATQEEFKALTDKAKEMGATTKYSASEAAQAMIYMAQAGWKAEEMINGIDGIMNLAAASGEELGITSDIVTDALTGFSMSAEEAGHFADVLAAAASNSNTNVEMMGDSFKYAAPLAGAFKMNVEDTALALGLMANAGIKGSQSGTALRTLFTKLSDDIVIMQKNGEELVVKTQNADGTMRNLKDIIDDLRSAFNGMSESEKNAINDDLIAKAKELNISLTDDNGAVKSQIQLYADVSEALNNATESMKGLTDAEKVAQAEEISSKYAMSGVLALINASEEDYNKLANAIYNCNGAAEEMAGTMIDNLKGDWTLLKSQLEGVAIQLGDVMIPMFRDAIENFSEWIDKFSKLDEQTQKNIVKFTLLAAALGPVLKIGGSVLNLVSGAVSTVGKLSSAMASAGGLIPLLKTMPMLFNPITLGIGAICTALVIWKSHCDKVKEANDKMLENARAYTENAKALENLKEKYTEVNKMTDDDAEKKTKLKEIQEALIDTYGIEAQGIDVVNGKYKEQLGLIDELNNKKSKDTQIAFDQNVINSENDLQKIFSRSYFTAGASKLHTGLFSDTREDLDKWHKTFSEISDDYKKLVELNHQNGNGISIQFKSKDAEEYKDILSDIILNARRYGLENTGLYSDLYKQWTNLTEALDHLSDAQKEAFTFKYNNSLSDAIKSLGLENVTSYTKEQANEIKEYFANSMKDASEEYKNFANAMLESLPLVGESINTNLNNQTEKSTESLNKLEEVIQSFTDTSSNCTKVVNGFSSDLNALDKAIEKVREGGELSGQEIVDLKEKYSDLDVKINETNGTRYIELESLQKLRDELPNLSKAQIETERERTKATIEEAKKRMQVYMTEQTYLRGIANYNAENNSIDWGNVPDNIKGNLLENEERRKQYQKALEEQVKIQEMQDSLKKFDDALNNIDIISSTKGKEVNTSKSKEKQSAMEKSLEEFEKSVKIGKTSLDAEMSYLEQIKSKYASTEEEKVDIEERMYQNWLSIIERKKQLGKLSADEEVKMYEQGLEKYSYTEYQKAEMSAKIIDTKVENAKKWIEQEKYYNRLSLEEEKAAYERIAAYENQSLEYKKEMAKEVYRVEKEMAKRQEDLEKDKKEKVKATVESNIKAKEEEYNKTVKLIEAERDKRVKAYQDQIDAMQEEYDREQELEKQQEYDEKIRDLEEKMRTVRTQEEFEDLAEQLNDTKKDKQQYTREQQLKQDKQILEDKIKAAENEASVAIQVEKDKLEAYKEEQNKLIDTATSTEATITDILKEQLKEREGLFAASIQSMIAMYKALPLSIGFGGAVASTISGATLAGAKNNLSSIATSNNYNSKTYNNNTTNNNATNNVTNNFSSQVNPVQIMNMLKDQLQKLNRSKGKR